MSETVKTILLLVMSNVFMTFAWYGHLKTMQSKPLIFAILASWGIALLEYCFQVPANRIGYKVLTLGELKVIQEIITMIVFGGFVYFYMGKTLTMNYVYAALCMVAAAYFMFRDGSATG